MKVTRGIQLIVLSAMVLFILGCQKGPTLGQISGVVRYEGKPLPQATVTFTPVDGRASFARTDIDGAYELKFPDGRMGAMLGENVISIGTYRVATDEQGGVVEFKETLPAKYNAESELTRVVEPGENVFDFELTKD